MAKSNTRHHKRQTRRKIAHWKAQRRAPGKYRCLYQRMSANTWNELNSETKHSTSLICCRQRLRWSCSFPTQYVHSLEHFSDRCVLSPDVATLNNLTVFWPDNLSRWISSKKKTSILIISNEKFCYHNNCVENLNLNGEQRARL